MPERVGLKGPSMPRIRELRSNMTSGEISPKLDMRLDVQQYFNGLEKIRNFMPIPKGGVRRRPGMEYILDRRIPVDALAIDKVRFIPYKDIITGDEYLLVFVDLFIDVYLNDVLQETITSAIDETSIPTFTYYQEDDKLLIFDKLMQPRYVTNINSGGGAPAFTLTTWDLINIPFVAFTDASGGATHREDIRFINFSASSPSESYTLFVNGHETPSIDYDQVDATAASNLKAGIEALPNVNSNIVVNVLATNEFSILFTGAGNTPKFWDVSVGVESFEKETTLIRLKTFQKGKVKSDPAWSASRGWPRCGLFHQGRLLMAGSTDLPSHIWGSRPQDPHDFDIERDDDDFGFQIHADSIGANVIHQMKTSRGHIQIFGTEAEFYIPSTEAEIMTPTTVSIKRATQVGSMQGVDIIEVLGSTVFVQRGGRGLKEFIFDEGTNEYVVNSLTDISSHLFTEVAEEKGGTLAPYTRLAYQKATAENSANYIYMIPGSVDEIAGERGRLLVYSFLVGENISAWTQVETRGDFQDIAIIGDEVYFATNRPNGLNANKGRLIEKFNYDLLFDAAVEGVGAATKATMGWLAPGSTTPPHPDNLRVECMVDGSLDATEDFFATGSGTGDLTFDNASVTNWQAGIEFPDVDGQGSQTWLKFMPFESERLGMPLIGEFKRLIKAVVSVFESSHFILNRNEKSVFREFETSVLDSGIEVKTGRVEIEGILGYDKEMRVEITQDESLPLTVLGVFMKVRF